MIPLHHFYHVYANGRWHEPVSEHVRALKQGGLLDNLSTLKIGIVGTPENHLAVQQFILSEGIAYELADWQPTGWEQVTQIPMWEFSQINEGLILYAHTKGASNPAEVDVRWRRSMTWHNVWRWRFAVEKLADHKSYGCHFIQPLLEGMPEHRQGNFMYAGTFFWTHCDLMRTWMRPSVEHPHAAEGWIGYKYAEEPWPVWDCTPYFPNTDTFMDGWIKDPNYGPAERGKSIPPTKTVNQL